MNDVKKPASHECGQITIIPCSGILEEVFPYFPPPVGGIPIRRFFSRDKICPVTLVHLHLGIFMVNVRVNIPYIEIIFHVWVNDFHDVQKNFESKKKQLRSWSILWTSRISSLCCRSSSSILRTASQGKSTNQPPRA